jgi:tetratricopeptide (TPR) repeat protein
MIAKNLRWLPGGAFFVFVLLLHSVESKANEESEVIARAAFKRAEVHFSLGEFGAALRFYGEAYRQDPRPAFLFNIAQCYRMLKRYERALFHYQQYLVRRPDAPNRADVQQLVASCKAELSKKSVAPPVAGRLRQERVVHSAKADSPSLRDRLLLWGGVGLASAMVVTSAITGGIASKKRAEFDRAATAEERDALRSSGQPLANAHYATLAIGASLGVGTVLYYLIYYRNLGIPSDGRVSAGFHGDGASIMLQGRF